MEFELQPSAGGSAAGGRLPWTGPVTASVSTVAVLAPPNFLDGEQLDDRHGLIRAATELLGRAQLQSTHTAQCSLCSSVHTGLLPYRCCIRPAPAAAATWHPRTHSHQQEGQVRGRQRRPAIGKCSRRRTSRSPTTSDGSSSGKPTASVTVAAGEVAQQAGKAVSSAGTAALRARPLQQLLAGGLAGAVSKTLVAPLERISTMLMTDGGHRFGMGEAVAHAWRDGGLAGLWRGNAATLAKIFPASAVQFATFHAVKDALLSARASAAGTAGHPKDSGELNNAERLVAGAAAGAASVALTYPLESTRTLMSVAGGMEGSLVAVCRRVVANGGVQALYRGFQATLVGDIVGNALGFTLYEIGARMYKDMNGGEAAPPSVRGVIGALSAACTMTLTMPLEVVRRRLQVQGTMGRPLLYRGTVDCMRQICAKEGIKGFYRASLPSYLKVAPSIGVMYFLFEVLTRQLAPPAEAGSGEGADQPAPQRTHSAGSRGLSLGTAFGAASRAWKAEAAVQSCPASM